MQGGLKKACIALMVAALCFVLFSFSCSSKPVNAQTVFADDSPAVKIPENALGVLESLQTAFRAVSDTVLPSVVEIDVVETKTVQNNPMNGFPFFFFGQPPRDGQGSDSREYQQSGLGSGVVVRKEGDTYYVLTNNHVAGSANEISVKMFDGRIFSAKLVGSDERKDIALVSFETKDNIPVAVLGNSDSVRTGDICFAMGTPLGYFSSVTQGIVSATGRSGSDIGNISDFIQTDAAINQGNSGGPLLNIYGEVIGINTWIASQSGGSQGLGFAIPINNIKKAIDDFISGGKVTYGWMGVSLIELTSEYQKSLGVENRQGALASQIFIGSPAHLGGVQAGDYVIKLNGASVKSVNQLVRDVGDLPVGQTAIFTVLRDGKEIELKVKIEARDNKIVSDNSKLWPGFIPAPISDEARKQLKLDAKVSGIIAAGIQAKSAAAIMGLQNGDILTAVNDKKVTSIKDFYSAMDGQKEIWFEVYRDGHTISTVKYKLQ